MALLGIYVLVAPSFAKPPITCITAENHIHIHDYLRITIEGQDVVIPANVGILPAHNCTEAMHTHDSSGIIHIELAASDANNNFTLGQFFKVWNFTYPTVTFNGTSHPVTFSNSNILGFRTDSTHKVVVLIDNKTVTNGVAVPMEQNDYCGPANGNVPPCANTAGGGILWDGGASYPYGPYHTIVIEYVRV